MIRELLGSEIKRRREQTGLTQTQFAAIAQISETTLSKWENGEIRPPAFFELALRYVEQNLDSVLAEIKPARARKKRAEVRAGISFRERFFDKTAKTEADCLVWLGATHSVRLDDGSHSTPRKAAWLLKYGELPAQDVKLKCVTKNCVAWQHLTLGRLAESGVRRLDLDKNAIRADFDEGRGLGIKALAAKYKCAVGTIYNALGRSKSENKNN